MGSIAERRRELMMVASIGSKSPFVKVGGTTPLESNSMLMSMSVPSEFQNCDLYIIKAHVVFVSNHTQILTPKVNSNGSTWINIGTVSAGDAIDTPIYIVRDKYTNVTKGGVVTRGTFCNSFSYPAQTIELASFYEDGPFGVGSCFEVYAIKNTMEDVT
jgi:hypothetical protein